MLYRRVGVVWKQSMKVTIVNMLTFDISLIQ